MTLGFMRRENKTHLELFWGGFKVGKWCPFNRRLMTRESNLMLADESMYTVNNGLF